MHKNNSQNVTKREDNNAWNELIVYVGVTAGSFNGVEWYFFLKHEDYMVFICIFV